MTVARKLTLSVVACALCASAARGDVHLVRSASGSALIFNDNIGSGWRVNGGAPNDAYLVARKNAVTPFDDTIATAARSSGIDPMLVKCVMLVEPNFNARAVSRKGASGLMQLMPATARRFGVSNIFDATENIRGGVRYLATLLGMFDGNVAHALAAYNAGEGAVTRHSGVPPYAETREYVRRALVAYQGTAVATYAYNGPVRQPPMPAIRGSFRGLAGRRTAPAVAAPVALDRTARVLANATIAARIEPMLGRTTP